MIWLQAGSEQLKREMKLQNKNHRAALFINSSFKDVLIDISK